MPSEKVERKGTLLAFFPLSFFPFVLFSLSFFPFVLFSFFSFFLFLLGLLLPYSQIFY